VDGVPLRIYGPEKTVADCFKHRNKIGLEVALEALKTYRRRKSFNVDKPFAVPVLVGWKKSWEKVVLIEGEGRIPRNPSNG